MAEKHLTPEISAELSKRISLVRRDIGNMLFHFTRKPESDKVEIKHNLGYSSMPASASAVLEKILKEGNLKGGSKWYNGNTCISFFDTPIQELFSIFTLNIIATNEKERPRYEPYGLGINKKWLFSKGCRPVIYDHPSGFDSLSDEEKYRFMKYDPTNGIDFTWEREWRIKTDHLRLDPKETLVIVPTAEEAFEIVYQFSEVEPDCWDESGPSGYYHNPKWLAVSLDLFGFPI